MPSLRQPKRPCLRARAAAVARCARPHRRHLLDRARHRRAQGAREAHRVPDARAVAPLQESAGGGAGDRRADGALQRQHERVPDALLAAPARHGARPGPAGRAQLGGRAADRPGALAAGAVHRGRLGAHRDERPRARLRPDAVHSLTLALHELATNAAKYGALSVPDGRVAVDWQVGRCRTGRPSLPHDAGASTTVRRSPRPSAKVSATS